MSISCKAYLNRLPVEANTRATLSARIDASEAAGMTPEEVMAMLHQALSGNASAAADDPALASVAARVRLGGLEPSAPLPSPVGLRLLDSPVSPNEGNTHAQIPIAPPLHRTPMAPHPWGELNPIVRWVKAKTRSRRHRIERAPSGTERQQWPAPYPDANLPEDDVVDSPDAQGAWQHNGNIRRLILLVLMLGQTALATWFMSRVLPYQGTHIPEMVTLVLFSILFCWVSAGFWTAMAGFLVLLRGSDRYGISRDSAHDSPIDASVRTAILMAICNEDVSRVMAGLRATIESVKRTGELDRFDFFILSDSNDPDICTAEVAAWADLCREVEGFGHIFYRRRRRRVKRKSGNIDDFCRRWGSDYRYMVVLDADSVMSGTCLTTLVQLMESNPNAGIIQTAPRAAGRETLYARIQQYATRVYGPLFTAGLHYWQLGESHYWGHNAIIRIEPFIHHCALAPLPGRGSLAGEILSHDFVEAALMRRAGWAVWIAYELDGSYEEMPPSLLDELKRDRRWCHGNLMNFRLFTARGMHPVHRAVFVTGVMAYLSAPLWFLFLALSTGMLAMHTLTEPQYFVEPRQLFPIWPQWHPEKAIALFTATLTLLFLPKLLSVLVIWIQGAKQYGGAIRVAISMLVEMVFSMLLAPVRMLFHTRFVAAAFLGWELNWKSPPRADNETTWGEAFRKHGGQTLLGLVWGGGIYLLDRSFLPWLLPIAGSLALSIPISVYSSRVSLGRVFRRMGLFVIPEEANPPVELRAMVAHLQAAPELPGFVHTVIDPMTNALLCAASSARFQLPLPVQHRRAVMVRNALIGGPESLSDLQKTQLLNDPLMLSKLHFAVWTSPDAHAEWKQAAGEPEGLQRMAAVA